MPVRITTDGRCKVVREAVFAKTFFVKIMEDEHETIEELMKQMHSVAHGLLALEARLAMRRSAQPVGELCKAVTARGTRCKQQALANGYCSHAKHQRIAAAEARDLELKRRAEESRRGRLEREFLAAREEGREVPDHIKAQAKIEEMKRAYKARKAAEAAAGP